MDKEKLKTMLNGSSKVVGSKQVLKGISDGTVRCVIVASDADADLKDRIVTAAREANVTVYGFSTMRKLGEEAGVDVAASAIGLLIG